MELNKYNLTSEQLIDIFVQNYNRFTHNRFIIMNNGDSYTHEEFAFLTCDTILCENNIDPHNNEKADKLKTKAWENGHSVGFYGIVNWVYDNVELIK